MSHKNTGHSYHRGKQIQINLNKAIFIHLFLWVWQYKAKPPGPDSALPLAGGRLNKDQASPRKGRWDFVLWSMLRKQGPTCEAVPGTVQPPPTSSKASSWGGSENKGWTLIKCVCRSLVLARLMLHVNILTNLVCFLQGAVSRGCAPSPLSLQPRAWPCLVHPLPLT